MKNIFLQNILSNMNQPLTNIKEVANVCLDAGWSIEETYPDKGTEFDSIAQVVEIIGNRIEKGYYDKKIKRSFYPDAYQFSICVEYQNGEVQRIYTGTHPIKGYTHQPLPEKKVNTLLSMC